jgi:hypothetical protein
MADEPIVSTKHSLGAFDAFETAKENEPIFVLQGGDPFAPATIEHWADLARTAGRKETNARQRQKLLAKATNAEQSAWIMREYQRDPDNYAAATEEKRFESEDVTDRIIILGRGCDRLNNSIFECLELADKLQALDEFRVERGKLREAAEIMRRVAKTIEPRRHMQDRKASDG